MKKTKLSKKYEKIYEKHKDTIEKICEQRSSYMSVVVGIPVQDIEQEIRLKCIQAIGDYKEKEGTLYAFLIKCVNNFLINLKRNKDNYSRWNPPCVWKGCIFFNKKIKVCTFFKNDDKSSCKSFSKYINKFNKRISISKPHSLDAVINSNNNTYSQGYPCTVNGEVYRNDLNNAIEDKLSKIDKSGLLVLSYKDWIHEGKEISGKIKQTIRRITKLIIED